MKKKVVEIVYSPPDDTFIKLMEEFKRALYEACGIPLKEKNED